MRGMVGKKHSEATKLKIRIALLGRKTPLSIRLKQSHSAKGKNTWSKGRKLSAEHKLKVSLSLLGNKRSLGYKHSLETSEKWSNLRRGENHYNWQGGLTTLNGRIRNSLKAKQWRIQVFERDNYICQECGKQGGELNADHIKPFALYPNLRFELLNGRTLCVPCHRKTATYGAKIRGYIGSIS